MYKKTTNKDRVRIRQIWWFACEEFQVIVLTALIKATLPALPKPKQQKKNPMKWCGFSGTSSWAPCCGEINCRLYSPSQQSWKWREAPRRAPTARLPCRCRYYDLEDKLDRVTINNYQLILDSCNFNITWINLDTYNSLILLIILCIFTET